VVDRSARYFNRLIWQIASPKLNFDDATFDRSSAFFDNPDHVSVVIHNYRWRLGLAEDRPQYDDLEKRLAKGPVISVPTITLEGDANGGASVIICLKKPRRPLPKLSSKSTVIDQH
jgi:hypothetical protein